MFIIRIINFGTGSAQVNIVGSINEAVRPLPALCQSINENSVTVLPETGIYYANVERQNMAILAPANIDTCLQNPNFVANGAAFSFQAYDSTLGTGQGQERQITATSAKLERVSTNAVTSFEDKFKAAIASGDDKRANAIVKSQKWNESKIDSIMSTYNESDAAKLATAKSKAKTFAA